MKNPDSLGQTGASGHTMRFAALAAEQERLDREKEAAAAGGGKAQSGANASTDERYSSDPFRVISEIEQEVAQQRVAPAVGSSKYQLAGSSSASKPGAVEEDNYLAPRWSNAPSTNTRSSPNTKTTNPDLAGIGFTIEVNAYLHFYCTVHVILHFNQYSRFSIIAKFAGRFRVTL